MPLLLLNDRNTTDRKNEARKRIAAAEACRVPKQTSNDEGRPQDLQIGGKNHSATTIQPEARLSKGNLQL
jgi:hypothetical protein